MKDKMFYVWLAVIALFTGEIVLFMMLYLVLMALQGIHQTLLHFYEDWKRRNNI